MVRKVSLLVSMLSIFVVSFLLSACGSASASAVSPINVGMICSCTGPYASSLVGDETTYKAWASATNRQAESTGTRSMCSFPMTLPTQQRHAAKLRR